MRVLLADDHPLVRDGMRPFVLRIAEDVDLVEAGSLDEALEKGKGKHLDLALLDLGMPGMKGVEGISRFRASFPKTKVIIVSGQIGSNEIGSSLAQGADGYIPKTIGGMGMIGAIQLVMAGEKYLPSIYLESMQAKRSGPQDSTRDIPADSPLAKLTPREWDILNKLVEGNPNKQIGRALGLEEITVKIHLCNVYRKLGVANRAQAVRVALQCGIEDMMKATV